MVPFTATALRTELLYGIMFLRLRRTKSGKTTDICSKISTDCAFFNKLKQHFSNAYVLYTTAASSFFPAGEYDRQLFLTCFSLKYFMTNFFLYSVTLIN